MIDINAILSDVIAKAVESHITELRAHYANIVGQLAKDVADLREQVTVNDQAAGGRISALESGWMHISDQQVAPLSARVDNLSAKVNELRSHAADFDCPAFSQAVREELYQMQLDDSLLDLVKEGVEEVVDSKLEDLDIGEKIEEALKYNVTLKVVVD
jgi:outer membrane murein-binding lipoprotein Lpp